MRFPELAEEPLLLVLLAVVDVDVLEQRLDVALDLAVRDAQLGEEREGAVDHVDLGVGAQQVVHRLEARAPDRDREVEIGAVEIGPEEAAHHGLAAAHEQAARLERRRRRAGAVGPVRRA